MQSGKWGRTVLVVFVAWLCQNNVATAENWPRFRGPNGTGTASDQDIPVSWNEQSILWKTEIPGAGNSSPVVWGDRIFLQSATKDGKLRSLLCLSSSDGAILWSAHVPGATARMHQKNSLASSTPAADGERVYAMFWDGRELTLYAYDFHGKLVWQHGLGKFASQHGPGTSPIVHEGRVFLANDQDGVSTLVALDAASGKTLWQASRRAFRACYSTPFFLDLPGPASQLIIASTAGVTSYNPGTGAENWSWEWKFDGSPLRTVASPIFAQGLIFAISGDGSGARHAVAIRPGSTNGSRQDTLVWENKKSLPYVPSMLAWGDHVFFIHDRGMAGCCVAKTGENLWTERLGGVVSASPILIDGKIFAASEDGNVYVLAASPSFKLLAKNALGEAIMATPAVADNRLYVRGATHLYCIGKPTAKRLTSAGRNP
jgi:outer membrane protein assembly factor BamB